ncbi:MAG: tRNA 2-thiouridine(34) synthase MnmA [Roseiflexaceae bacterium]|nr:tRNA 2-thiouridine(34) synthase MnmA [Roseiflexaceae bacterium]
MAKVIVAMSGGVDSSLAAALLQEQGHEVIGVTMHLWDGDDDRLAESLCCSVEIAESARRVCAQLGIPYYMFNYQKEFRRHVIDFFLKEYAQGFTPNPCLACNRDVKFRALLDRATAFGVDYVATGHYARIRQDTALPTPSSQSLSPRFQLLRAVDLDKDQAYMLHTLGQEALSRLIFPIGELTKGEVRERAKARGLFSADRPESQDICFVPGGDYRNLLREEHPESILSGPILDLEGRELGRHQGLPLYTVGQRRGLGIAAAHPLYVVALDPTRNAVVIGPAEALEKRELLATQVTFVSGDWPTAPFSCQAQISSHAESFDVLVVPTGETCMRVEFAQPQRAITPGQAVVLYAGEIVLGGGRIS